MSSKHTIVDFEKRTSMMNESRHGVRCKESVMPAEAEANSLRRESAAVFAIGVLAVVLMFFAADGCSDQGTSVPVTEGNVHLQCFSVPAGFDSITVTISQISAVLNGSAIALLAKPVTIRVSEYSGSSVSELVQGALPIGDYSKITVIFSGITLLKDSARVPVSMSPAAQYGSEFLQRFSVLSDSVRALILEINPYRSLTQQTVTVGERDSSFYLFSPVIRLAQTGECGHLTGRVTNPGKGTEVALLQGERTVTVVPVSFIDGTFRIAYVPEAVYSVLARDTLTARIDSVAVRHGVTTDIGVLTLQ